MLSIVVPSRNELFLNATIRDVLYKAIGEIEIFPVLDGYEPLPDEMIDDPRVHYIHLAPTREAKKRQAINQAVAIASGKYLMCLDAHCMLGPGFDGILIADHQENWVSIPRRHRLDAENWQTQIQSDDRPPIDYEYFMYPGKVGKNGLHGFKWDARTLARANVLIDDTLTCQGSCWMMTKAHFERMGFMQIEGYTGWGQEAEEIGLTTRLHGGRMVTNKRTWYAHLHKGKKYGRMYFLSKADSQACNDYTYNLWVNEHRDFFVNLIEGFMPVPGWPEDRRQWAL